MLGLLNNDIIGEILKYSPYKLSRSINKNFNKISDIVELSKLNHKPIKYDLRHIEAYIKTQPDTITWVVSSNIARYYYHCYKIGVNVYMCCNSVNNTYNDINSSKWGPIKVGIPNDIHTIYEKIKCGYNNNIIMGPNFIRFFLSKHPLCNNINYIRKRLLATVFNISNINEISAFCLDMNLQSWYLTYNVDSYNIFPTKKLIINALDTIKLYPYTDIQLDNNNNIDNCLMDETTNNNYYIAATKIVILGGILLLTYRLFYYK